MQGETRKLRVDFFGKNPNPVLHPKSDLFLFLIGKIQKWIMNPINPARDKNSMD